MCLGNTLQVKEFAREEGIALVRNLAHVMNSLQETVAKLPPCCEEMEVSIPPQLIAAPAGASVAA